MPDYRQVAWNDACRDACRELVRAAMREDLGGGDLSADITTAALVPPDVPGRAVIAARKPGVIAGLPCVEIALHEYDQRLAWEALAKDGASVVAGQTVGRVIGPARSLLTAERTLLNILGRLSGVATLTRRYVDATQGTKARIYDTRKTTPGWRLLEKYAVRLGGGHNHRLNLAEGILIKDNHLALGAQLDRRTDCQSVRQTCFTPAEAVRRARAYLAERAAEQKGRESISRQQDSAAAQNSGGREIDSRPLPAAPLIEVEVDRLDQLDEVLGAGPDLVLLDNMTPEDMRRAVARRDQLAPTVELEASGSVDLGTVAAVARTGIDRISVGALTHSAAWFDVGLDWQP
jgi:nicotinate-nucleotide pyrophosphorylase (carboxylating)